MSSTKNYERVVIHLDLDAFYSQVEQIRLGLPKDTPLIVLQHDMTLAVSYAARPFGVKRGDTRASATQKCPHIVVVPVAELNNKPNLTLYRDESVKIFAVFRSFGATVERASIDEAYLDVTKLVNANLASVPPVHQRVFEGVVVSRADGSELAANADDSSSSDGERDADDDGEGDGSASGEAKHDAAPHVADVDSDADTVEADDVEDQCRARLWLGAQLAAKIRAKVFEQLHYTVSAGISFNKILAKIGSGRNKPNNQTTILPSSVPFLLARLPVRKLPGLGGKFGKKLVELFKDVQFAGDLERFSLADFRKSFSAESAQWLYDIARGFDAREVRDRSIVKSVTAYKQVKMTPIARCAELIDNLAQEMSERLQRDRVENQRTFNTLTLSLRDGRGSRTLSLTPLPTALTSAVLSQAMWNGLKKIVVADGVLGLGLAAHNFVDLPTRTLSQYFVAKAVGATETSSAIPAVAAVPTSAPRTSAMTAPPSATTPTSAPRSSALSFPRQQENLSSAAVADDVACPVCQTSLAGRSALEASTHVDRCLQRSTTTTNNSTSAKRPQTAQPSAQKKSKPTAGLMDKFLKPK
jgi:DNA polymerase eta